MTPEKLMGMASKYARRFPAYIKEDIASAYMCAVLEYTESRGGLGSYNPWEIFNSGKWGALKFYNAYHLKCRASPTAKPLVLYGLHPAIDPAYSVPDPYEITRGQLDYVCEGASKVEKDIVWDWVHGVSVRSIAKKNKKTDTWVYKHLNETLARVERCKGKNIWRDVG